MQALFKSIKQTGSIKTINNRKSIRTTLLETAGAALIAGAMLFQPLAATTSVQAHSAVAEALPATGAPLASRYFSPTGKTVRGEFLSTFNKYGLNLMGYPVSEERTENGRTVQYFERVRMEWHPEVSGQSYPVLMGRLGVEMTQGSRFERVAAVASTAAGTYFPSTGHSLSGGFYSYWKANGDIALFGYPISEEFKQDGLTVQWFERARFEYHPESPSRPVQLTLLGSTAYSAQADRTAAAPAAQQKAAPAQSVSLTELESYVLQSVNDQRAAAGLSPVKLDAGVTDLARARSNDMAARNYFSHTTPEGSKFLDMLVARKISYKFAGEILARNNYPDDQTGKTAMDSYINSAPHKAIIMDGRYNSVGVGHAVSADGMHYFTIVFIQQ